MALDEAILEANSKGESPPTLRLYSWQPACLSLGYAQPFSDVDQQRLRMQEWDLVRRPSGGRAILHTDELTYALIAPANNPYFAGDVPQSYRRLSQGLAAALRSLGLSPEVQEKQEEAGPHPTSAVCFQIPSAYEIKVGGKKMIGSAQVRRRGVVLQHGSLPLQGDITRICKVLTFASDHARDQASALLRASATTVEASLGKAPTWQQAADALIAGFSSALGMAFERSEASKEEALRAHELAAARFANPAWLARI